MGRKLFFLSFCCLVVLVLVVVTELRPRLPPPNIHSFNIFTARSLFSVNPEETVVTKLLEHTSLPHSNFPLCEFLSLLVFLPLLELPTAPTDQLHTNEFKWKCTNFLYLLFRQSSRFAFVRRAGQPPQSFQTGCTLIYLFTPHYKGPNFQKKEAEYVQVKHFLFCFSPPLVCTLNQDGWLQHTHTSLCVKSGEWVRLLNNKKVSIRCTIKIIWLSYHSSSYYGHISI